MAKKKKTFPIISLIFIAVLLAAVVILSIKLCFLVRKSEGPYDISISTQAGFTQDKVDEIRAIDGVISLVGVCEQVTDSDIIQSFPEDVITPELIEGRQVQSENEVVVDSRYAEQKNLHLGQKIPLRIGENASRYTIVGIAVPCFDMQSPAKPFFFVDVSAFHADGYNRIYLCVARNTSISSVQKEINSLGYLGQKNRYEQLRKGVQSKISETEKLMDTLLGPIEEELDQAKEQLNAAQRQLDISGNTAKITEAETQLQTAKGELDSSREQLDGTKETLNKTQEELAEKSEQLQKKTADYQETVGEVGISAAEIDTRLAQLQEESAAAPEDTALLQSVETLKALQSMRTALETDQNNYDAANVQFKKDMITYRFSEYGYQTLLTEYEDKAAELENQKSAFEAEKAAFAVKQAEYRQAEKEYLAQKREYEQQIESYQAELDAIQPADWIISCFGQDGTLLRLEDAVF